MTVKNSAFRYRTNLPLHRANKPANKKSRCKKPTATSFSKGLNLPPAHKPDFVRGYHLSAMVITDHLFLPTLDGSQ
jgi:hypothetical protein